MTEPRRATVQHRIEHALFSSVVFVAGLVGERASAAFGAGIGRLGYFPLGFRRKHVEKHLRIAFPDKNEAWRREVMRSSYAHLGREALATIRLGRLDPEQVIAKTRVTRGLPELQAALDAGQGVVIVSGHVGNHEIGAAALAARGVPIDVVVQQQGNPLFDAALNDTRRRLGIGIIDRFQAQRLAIKALRRGRAVAFASDQNAGRTGLFVPFFGKPASTHRGAALFAVKTGAPLFLAAALRRGDHYEISMDRVDVDRDGDLDDVVLKLTTAFTNRLEAVVRSAPDQYLWLHRRWKTRPPESDSEERNADKQV